MAEADRPGDRRAVDRPYVDRPVADLAAARAVATAAAVVWGLPPPELLRRGMNVLFGSGDVVIRVGHATAHPRLAHELVRLLADRGVPTAPPVAGLVRMVGDLAVSAWQRVPTVTAPVDWRAIGAAVRRVHSIDVGDVPAGYPTPSPSSFPWWDFEALLAEVADAIDGPALDGIASALERHAGWRRAIGTDAVLCHGDVHPGNVIAGPRGPVLLDWDLLCVATPAWDHAMLTTYATRWGGDPSVYAEFADGYGTSLADDATTRTLAELRNVAATLMRVRAGRSDAAAAGEAERRLRYWRGDPSAPTWQAQ